MYWPFKNRLVINFTDIIDFKREKCPTLGFWIESALRYSEKFLEFVKKLVEIAWEW